nr:phosphotransferase family protein [Conexibacter arvalis]
MLVLEPLAAFLDAHRIGSGPIDARPIGDGHSNVTYGLRRGDAHVVLRRPPRPPLPPSAHDVVREARLQRALAGHARVPEILAICDDESILGVPFYVMGHVAGAVAGPTLPPALDAPGQRGRFGAELVDALAELHAVDVETAGLGGFGRGAGYLARQLRRFRGLWAQYATRDLPDLDRTARWLEEHLPDSGPATLVHGDYRLGNVVFERSDELRLAAILDWELATLGDPLADLGYLTATWAEPGDDETPMLALSAATRLPGFSSRDDLRERYARRTGRDLERLAWHETLATWKAAIFLECSYSRYLAGSTDDPYFGTLAEGVPQLARAAARRIAAG